MKRSLITLIIVFMAILGPISAKIYADHHIIQMAYGTQFRTIPEEKGFGYVYEYRGKVLCRAISGDDFAFTDCFVYKDKQIGADHRDDMNEEGYPESDVLIMNTKVYPVTHRITGGCCGYDLLMSKKMSVYDWLKFMRGKEAADKYYGYNQPKAYKPQTGRFSPTPSISRRLSFISP